MMAVVSLGSQIGLQCKLSLSSPRAGTGRRAPAGRPFRATADLRGCAPAAHVPIRMRLNKHISDTGFCSRREADRLIGEGRVTVNGMRARIGAEVGEDDDVRVDGQPLRVRSAAKGQRRHVYIALNKPVGVTCTT